MHVAVPDTVPEEKQACLRNTVEALAAVDGVLAIVLAGSYARGTQQAHSDIDLGIYYSESTPFPIGAVRQVASRLSDGPPPVVTDFYEWGPWVNGGAWIQTAVGKVDFLYRNIEQVEQTIESARGGFWSLDYNQQPTFGFHSVIYLAETQACIPLWDPQALIVRLKQQVADYPPKLRCALIADSLWGAEFTLLFARQYATGGDVYNTVGCLVRIAAYLTQALYALNRTYFAGDKGALEAVRRFAQCPREYVERLSSVLARPGRSRDQLLTAVNELGSLWQETVSLAGNAYSPRYPLHAG